MDFSNFNITIVGLGLIGGSFAMGIGDLKPKNLWAVEKNVEITNMALHQKIITKGFTEAKDILPDSDVIVLALYPEETIKFLQNNMKYFKSGCIITDTCGLKAEIFKSISNVLRNDVQFVGGHPMAGKESSGFCNADKTIFHNANYFITPTMMNTQEALSVIRSLITSIGCKKVIEVSPEEHDRVISYTSHLPHILAISLINCFETSEELNGLIGGSFKDATRVADINSILWAQLIRLNKGNLLNTLDCFLDNINTIKTAILEEDEDCLLEAFNKASTRRKGIG